MPSPNSQNLRSAPQKQPRPNIAFSEPAGYGPFNARPLTKCVSSVRIACERPGNASAAVGMAVFLKPNMGGSPRFWPIYRLSCARRNARHDHDSCRNPQGRLTGLRCLARVADQRLLLAAEHDEDD